MTSLEYKNVFLALWRVGKRVIVLGLYYIIGSIVSFIKDGISIWMVLQAILAFYCIISFQFSRVYVVNNVLFDHKKQLRVTDIPAILLTFFGIGYYVIYNGILLFTSFNWTDLGLLVVVFYASVNLFKNASAFNVLIGVLHKFKDFNSIEVEDNEWKVLSAKWNFDKIDHLPTSKALNLMLEKIDSKK